MTRLPSRLLCCLVCFTLVLGAGAAQASMEDAMDAALQGEEQAQGIPTAPPAEGRRALVIAGESYASDMNPAFEQAHPEVEVQIQSGQEHTMRQLLLDITTQGAQVDIYILHLSSGLFDAARKKGLALDLSHSQAIADFARGMAPYARDRVTEGDQVYAIPYELMSRQAFGFNRGLGQALSIPQPAGLTELLVLWAGWAGREDAQGAFLTSGPLWDPFGRLLAYGVDAYIAEHSQGEYVSFGTTAFRAYISALAQQRDRLAALHEAHSGWREHIKDRALLLEEYPLLRTQEDIGLNFPGATPFAMPLDAGGTPVIPADMSVFMINAASNNKELALQYLEALVTGYPPAQRILIDDRCREPVEQPNYRENRETYLQEKERLTTLLADPANHDSEAALREQLAQNDLILEEIESQRWLITPQDIAGYEAIKPYFRLMPRISYAYYDSIPATKQLFHSFVQGEMDADSFVEQLGRMQRLINLEGE